MLVLHALRGGLSDRRRHRQHSLSPEVAMSSPFESYDDLEDADERLQAADPGERRVAIIALGHSGDPAAVAHLANMVADPDAGVRRAAVSALAFSQMKPAAETITRALKDTDWMVREMAAETLGLNVNGSLAADQLIACLADEFWQVRLKAIRSLGKMKIDRAVRPIGNCI